MILPILGTYTSCYVVEILQTERSISLLCVLSNGKALHFRFRLPTHLQCLSSGKAETYCRILGDSRLQLPSAMTGNFTHRVHLVCTDGDLALSRCIRAFASQPGGFEALRVKCEVHKVYGWHKSVFNHTALVLSTLKHIARVLNSGDSMRSFRATLRTVLESCVLYRPNSTPSSSDLKHNVACLDLFMPSTNGKASTGIDTVLGKWSTASSRQRGAPLHGVLHKWRGLRWQVRRFLCRSCCWNGPSHLATGQLAGSRGGHWLDWSVAMHPFFA